MAIDPGFRCVPPENFPHAENKSGNVHGKQGNRREASKPFSPSRLWDRLKSILRFQGSGRLYSPRSNHSVRSRKRSALKMPEDQVADLRQSESWHPSVDACRSEHFHRPFRSRFLVWEDGQGGVWVLVQTVPIICKSGTGSRAKTIAKRGGRRKLLATKLRSESVCGRNQFSALRGSAKQKICAPRRIVSPPTSGPYCDSMICRAADRQSHFPVPWSLRGEETRRRLRSRLLQGEHRHRYR